MKSQKLSQKQKDALKQIVFENWKPVDGRTMRSLKQRGLVNAFGDLTEAGYDAAFPDAPPVEVKPEVLEARRVQDELVNTILDRGWSLAMRLSMDLPADITGGSIARMVYPEYLSDFHRMIIQFKKDYSRV